MGRHKINRRSGGFTMVETLAVVAILVILFAISAVAVVYYRDLLKITELDNAAREIYMAAENRAVLLKDGGQLDSALEASSAVSLSAGGAAPLAEGGGAQRCYVEGQAAVDKGLLTAGAIDPALLEGDFVIVYEPVSGSVTDVFYTEKKNGVGEISAAFTIAGDRDARMRRDGGMLGYYGGENSGSRSYTPLDAAQVMIEVHNEDRLTVDVTFALPEGAGWEQAEKKVELVYGGQTLNLLLENDTTPVRQPAITENGSRRVYTWVLDSLEEGRHFRQLFTGDTLTFGGDFTVNAEIKLSEIGRKSSTASGSDTGNSLFAEGSGAATARIENLRHLQNLDAETSRVGEKTGAVQLKDIVCNTYMGRDYDFTPIVNDELTSFYVGWNEGGTADAKRYELRDLHVTQVSAAGKTGAGLFASSTDGEENAPVTFTGVRLVNAQVEAGDKTAGALVGKAGAYNAFHDVRVTDATVTARGDSAAGGVAGTAGIYNKFKAHRIVNVTVKATTAGETAAGGIVGKNVQSGAGTVSDTIKFEDCRVYWEDESQLDLRGTLGSSDGNGNTRYNYQITGANAGGLVGQVCAYSEITESFAATLVDGAVVGGLVGRIWGPLTVKTSYADCYLRGTATVGGLVGQGQATVLTNVYTAGFIDGQNSARTVGGIRGEQGEAQDSAGSSTDSSSGSSTAEYVYAAVGYVNVKEGAALTPTAPGTVDHCYYLDSIPGGVTPPKSPEPSTDPEAVPAKDYDSMIGNTFFGYMGGAFEHKVHNSADSKRTYPYNLQENQNLRAYSFPGLVGLPHYGDWRAIFKEPSLVYYERYNKAIPAGTKDETMIGFSGGNARYLVGEVGALESETHVVTDGYAVALRADDLGKGNSFTIQYTYLDAEGKLKTSDPLTYYVEKPGTGGGTQLLQAKWDGNPYYLAPLPEKLVTQDYAQADFYQYLGVKIADSDMADLNGSSEYFYNPHFAETVEPYSEEGSLVSGPTDAEAAEKIQAYTAGMLPAGRTLPVSVRTPRHLYDLSKFEEYYHAKHSLSFHQGLDLDYTLYKGYDFQTWPAQKPVGASSASYFTGSYDGGCHFIKNTPLDLQDSAYAGLFGYSTGTLEDIVYIQAPDAQPVLKLHKDTTLGALAGHNAGTIRNCAVAGVNLTLNASDSIDYIGGLVGENVGRIENCAAEVARLHVEAYNYCKVYAGGLVGRNTSALGVSGSYAVGRLSAKTEKEDENVSLSGFAGQNPGGVIRGCYAAMDLVADGAGAKAYGFCHSGYSGRQGSVYFLDRGNFTYREQSFLAGFDGARAARATWAQLTGDVAGDEKLPLAGMAANVAAGYVEAGAETEGDRFPFYSGVTDATGQRVHYGLWPTPMELGEMGLYYWEEVRRGGQTSCHFTALAVDTDQFRIVKDSTLSKLHDEGGEVTRYGYGFYSSKYADDMDITVKPASDEGNGRPLLYWGDEGKVDFAGGFAALEEKKETAAPSSPLALDKEVDKKLAELNEGYEFHSFHTYDLDETPSGLYPQAGQQNCVLTLEMVERLDDGTENVLHTAEFTLSPFFADAMSVKPPKVGDASLNLISKLGEGKIDFNTAEKQTPGSEGNPYEVRSVSQLKLMNWYDNPEVATDPNRTTTNVMTAGNVYTAPDPTGPGGGLGGGVEPKPNEYWGGYYVPMVGLYTNEPTLNHIPHPKGSCPGHDEVGYLTFELQQLGVEFDYQWQAVEVRWVSDKDHYIKYDLDIQNHKLIPTLYDRTTQEPVEGPLPDTPSSGDGGPHFPYLNSQYQTTSYHWEQTYDLMGQGKHFTPIAEYYDTSTGNYGELKGWFGGVYDGGGYMIEDLDIRGQRSSCAGLFGVVYDGSLHDIVLYSSSGESVVTTQSNPGSETNSQWIAMGALAGVAGTGDKGKNAIENCSVSGYTIAANVGTNHGAAWGGANIGGLVGASHMNLSGCSAVVNVALIGAQVYDNVRVGGLAGICQGSVTHCYAGGEITFGKKTDINEETITGIYVGGLVGGSYMHPLAVSGIKVRNEKNGLDDAYIGKVIQSNEERKQDNTGNTLTGCYSYVKLPSINAHSRLYGLYAVGGTGELNPVKYATKDNATGIPSDAANHGVCTMTNCYYLESEVLANNQDLIVEKVIKVGQFDELGKPILDGDGNPVVVERPQIFKGRDAVVATLEKRNNKERKTDMSDTTLNPDPDFYPIATPVTYEQLAGRSKITAPAEGKKHVYEALWTPDANGLYRWIDKAPMQEQSIYDLLNVSGGAFAPVTKEVGGLAVPGRYSYPPATSPQLAGLDYPFPTIMTKAGNHVHYGSWPLSGFYRVDQKGKELGGAPIRIDLFAEKPYTEFLVLTDETKKDGTWGLTYANKEDAEKIAGMSIKSVTDTPVAGKQGASLTVKGLREGTFPLTITYTEPGGASYSLTISVHVGAEVKLRPATVYMFPNDRVTVKLLPINSEGKLLMPEPVDQAGAPAATSALTLGTLRAISSIENPEDMPAPLAADIAAVGAAKRPGVTLTTHGASGLSTVNAQFTYTVGADAEAKEYDCEDVIQVPVITPWTTDWARSETLVEQRVNPDTGEIVYTAVPDAESGGAEVTPEGGETGGTEGGGTEGGGDEVTPEGGETGGTEGGGTEGGGDATPKIYTRAQDTCTITFPNTYSEEGNTLLFAVNAVELANKDALGEDAPELTYETVADADGVKTTTITLTYPAVYTNAEDAEGQEVTPEQDGTIPAGEPKLPDAELALDVTVTSPDDDTLIPEAQEHALTLTAQQPDRIRLEDARAEQGASVLSGFEADRPAAQDTAQGDGAEPLKRPVTISEAAPPPENKAKDEQEVLNEP